MQLLTDRSSPNFPLFCSLPLHVLLIFIALALVSVHIMVLSTAATIFNIKHFRVMARDCGVSEV